MRLLIDLRLPSYRPGGIAWAAGRLAAELARCPIRLDVTALTAARGSPIDLPGGIARRVVHTPPHFRWERTTLSAELWRERWQQRWEIAHWPGFVPGARGLGRTIITIHDLAFVRRPGLVTSSSGRYYRRVKDEARRADAVIAVSEATRRDVIELLDVCPDRVFRVPHGLDPEFCPVAKPGDQAAIARYGIREPYLLFVGTVEPRKNLPCLIEAFDRARRRGIDPETRLVLAGASGWLADPIYQAAYASPSRSRIVFTGRVPSEVLPALYRRAAALVLPSLDEGFGLPVLEAMGCGTPVVCSDLPALREVASDAARFCPVGDSEALAVALVETLTRPAETWAGRARALERAAAFTWSAAAEATLRVYRSALGGS